MCNHQHRQQPQWSPGVFFPVGSPRQMTLVPALGNDDDLLRCIGVDNVCVAFGAEGVSALVER
eukprot:8282817-Lingulodinium_polyedra.AAC.1